MPERRSALLATQIGVFAIAILSVALLFATPARAQLKLLDPPISYLEKTPQDAVADLLSKLERGDAKLEFETHFGYLRSLLTHLQVPITSQALVFSKTSLQVKHISPRSPRSIYFNDEVYVGWVPGGNIEISAVDPQLGTNFYLLQQQDLSRPKLARQTYDCLQCHGSVTTRDVPGHMVLSVSAGADGHLLVNRKSYVTDDRSPLSERWGGWYVTGHHGQQRHLGNLFFKQSQDLSEFEMERGANVTDLSLWFDTSRHLSPHSDIVALMVLEHQANMHNRLARAGFLARIAVHTENAPRDGGGESAADRAKETAIAMRAAAGPVVEYLLFTDEATLKDKITGTSGFAEEFTQQGPRDRRGRSLREFDLQTRLFKHPCSYLIYSAAFDQLHPALKAEIYRQLWEALSKPEADRRFRHLSDADRRAIIEIVRDTKSDLPDYWLAKD